MHSFEVHSDESACRKKVLLGLEQVIRQYGVVQYNKEASIYKINELFKKLFTIGFYDILRFSGVQ